MTTGPLWRLPPRPGGASRPDSDSGPRPDRCRAGLSSARRGEAAGALIFRWPRRHLRDAVYFLTWTENEFVASPLPPCHSSNPASTSIRYHDDWV